jgi:hypothetical protein
VCGTTTLLTQDFVKGSQKTKASSKASMKVCVLLSDLPILMDDNLSLLLTFLPSFLPYLFVL